MFGGGFNATKLKPQLKMAVHRFQISSNKKAALMKQQKKEIAKMLAEIPPKEEKARIKAESLIRDDYTIEAYEIMMLECELLSERIKLLSAGKECPADLVSCVSTLMWASARVDNIPELTDIRKQFKAKYGKKFDEAAMANTGGILNERVMAKLSVQPPSAYTVQVYLEKIAKEFEVDWEPQNPVSQYDMAPTPGPDGYSVPMGGGSGYGGLPVLTGTDVTNNYYDGSGGGSVPPPAGGGGGGGGGTMAPGAYSVTGPARGKPDDMSSIGGGSSTAPSAPPPMAYAEPYESKRSLGSGSNAPPPPQEEEDIYVPGSAGKQRGKMGGASSQRTYDEPRDDGESGPNYDDLKNRFSQL